MKEEIEKGIENEEFLRFQYKELEDANLEVGMQEKLEAEAEKLNHVEDIKSALYQADGIMSGSEGNGVVEQIKEAAKAIEGIKDIFPDVEEINSRLEDCYIELKDLAQEINVKAEDIDFEPGRLQQVDDLLHEQICNIDNSDERLKELEAEEQKTMEACKKKAATLTATRKKAAKIVEEGMKKRLVPLGIPNVRFAIDIEPKDFMKDGCDRVSFLFSANTNTELQPVSQVASGGEIARVMLSLKAMISSAVKLPTIIFDEIDTGVSGKIAEKMAIIMQEMAQSDRQVISITHLPQIAARGTNHYKVYKEETNNGTTSRMKELQMEERTDEIAQMLSGADITEAARHNAAELLKLCSN